MVNPYGKIPNFCPQTQAKTHKLLNQNWNKNTTIFKYQNPAMKRKVFRWNAKENKQRWTQNTENS